MEFHNPIVGNTDPPSSQAAADRVNERGTRARHASMVLALVRKHPGRTAVELHELQAVERLERHEISRRLSDLAHAGSVRHGVTRPCSVAGTSQVTWYAVEADGQRLLF